MNRTYVNGKIALKVETLISEFQRKGGKIAVVYKSPECVVEARRHGGSYAREAAVSADIRRLLDNTTPTAEEVERHVERLATVRAIRKTWPKLVEELQRQEL